MRLCTISRACWPYGLTPRASSLPCQFHPDVPDRLIGDSGRLRQVLVNLIDNAIKFTGAGEVVIEVKRLSSVDDVVALEFRVSDTGIGVPSNQHAMIFRPFVQADGSTTRMYGGTGFGPDDLVAIGCSDGR